MHQRELYTDGDGLKDGDEVSAGTNPLKADTDCDGLSDRQELELGLNPCQPDTDGDGMYDGWEYKYRDAGFDPAVNNANDGNPKNDFDADSDGDGLTNGEEADWDTNPDWRDQDGDGRPDGWDTDGDGVCDGVEAGLGGSDPRDSSDGGRPGSRVKVSFYFGDHSDSTSERYNLSIKPVQGSGSGKLPSAYSFVNEHYGKCETKDASLKPGWKYEVKLKHAGTKPELMSSIGYADYDYTLVTTGTLPQNVIIVDGDGLLRVYNTGEGREDFSAADKVAYIYVMKAFTIVSHKEQSYDVCTDGKLIDSRPAIITVSPCDEDIANRITFEAKPVEKGKLVNENYITKVTFKHKKGSNKWKTSPIYWYGAPNKMSWADPNEYAFTMKVEGKDCVTRKCPVYWPERAGKCVWNNKKMPQKDNLRNSTHPCEAIRSEDKKYYYCIINFEDFDIRESDFDIFTEPPGPFEKTFSWSGQYMIQVKGEEEYHLDQYLGRVEREMGGQSDCFTPKGIEFFVAAQAGRNRNIIKVKQGDEEVWAVKGRYGTTALAECKKVIKTAILKEIEQSMKIVNADRGFRERTAKDSVGYNAAWRYEDTSYFRTYGPSPENHDHPAYE